MTQNVLDRDLAEPTHAVFIAKIDLINTLGCWRDAVTDELREVRICYE